MFSATNCCQPESTATPLASSPPRALALASVYRQGCNRYKYHPVAVRVPGIQYNFTSLIKNQLCKLVQLCYLNIGEPGLQDQSEGHVVGPVGEGVLEHAVDLRLHARQHAALQLVQ